MGRTLNFVGRGHGVEETKGGQPMDAEKPRDPGGRTWLANCTRYWIQAGKERKYEGKE